MIIDCPKCDKKFELDQKLIPVNGRLLQCGNCFNKWFFKPKNLNEIKKDEAFIETKEKADAPEQETQIEKDEVVIETKEEAKYEEKKKEITKQKYNVNYFKLFLTLIISFVALILILDTFKDPLTSIFPNIKIILDNLYQSFEDIKLFLLDLIK